MQHTANLIVAANYRVELALAGCTNKVGGIFAEGLVVLVATGALHVLPLAKFLDGGQHVGLVATSVLKDATGGGLDLHEGHKNGLYGNKLIAQLARVVLGTLQHLIGIVGEIRLSAFHMGQMLEFLLHQFFNLHGIDAQLLKDEIGNVATFLQHSLQQVGGLNSLLSALLGGVDGLLHHFLRFDCKLVECHIITFLSFLFLFLSMFCTYSLKSHSKPSKTTNRHNECQIGTK